MATNTVGELLAGGEYVLVRKEPREGIAILSNRAGMLELWKRHGEGDDAALVIDGERYVFERLWNGSSG